MNAKKPMAPDRLERLLKALPALADRAVCVICAEVGVAMRKSHYLIIPAVLRELGTQQRPLCSLCAVETALINDECFVNIERALRMRRYFIERRRRCSHCFKRAVRWCEDCGALLCDSDATAIHRGRCVGRFVTERPDDVYAAIYPKRGKR